MGAGVGRQEVAEVLVHASSNRVAVRWQAAQRWQAMASVPIAGLTASDAASAKLLMRLPILQAQTLSHHPLTSTLRACSLMHTPLSFWSSTSSGCVQHLAPFPACDSACGHTKAGMLVAFLPCRTSQTGTLVAHFDVCNESFAASEPRPMTLKRSCQLPSTCNGRSRQQPMHLYELLNPLPPSGWLLAFQRATSGCAGRSCNV